MMEEGSNKATKKSKVDITEMGGRPVVVVVAVIL